MIGGRPHDRKVTCSGERQTVPPGRQPNHDLQGFTEVLADQTGPSLGVGIQHGPFRALVTAEEERPAGEVAGHARQGQPGRQPDGLAVVCAREVELANVPQQLSELSVAPDRVQDVIVARHAAHGGSVL
ncbi:hypothetical protein [Kitasatospora sp. DSM 101779]|uniref:hypothetical protein n=1 Tax=Kitasatospora sp. DSM 101779 TaxID=2853165 RepID=UPI0021D93288|nr:hypothetical protein [Kitasatospora sp. DSM 101779]MCU7827095.1 hypothetical protein [Kitasatospora sp. DSM 101779]